MAHSLSSKEAGGACESWSRWIVVDRFSEEEKIKAKSDKLRMKVIYYWAPDGDEEAWVVVRQCAYAARKTLTLESLCAPRTFANLTGLYLMTWYKERENKRREKAQESLPGGELGLGYKDTPKTLECLADTLEEVTVSHGACDGAKTWLAIVSAVLKWPCYSKNLTGKGRQVSNRRFMKKRKKERKKTKENKKNRNNKLLTITIILTRNVII